MPAVRRLYLIEKTLKSGVYLTCPNNKRPASADENAEEAEEEGREEEDGHKLPLLQAAGGCAGC